MTGIDTTHHRGLLQDLVAQHYHGCDNGDLNLATSMMLEDVQFTLPALGQRFTNREQTKAGLATVITKLPKMSRHRPAGFRFSSPDPGTLRACFTTHIMSCVDGQVHAIGDITVDTILRDDAGLRGDAGLQSDTLVVRSWEVCPIYFRGLISAGKLAFLPRLLLATVPFLLPREVRELFEAAAGRKSR